MVGQACYLITNSLDYNMEFNNQNLDDEHLTKLLLMLPMVPKRKLPKIKFSGEVSSSAEFGKGSF